MNATTERWARWAIIELTFKEAFGIRLSFFIAGIV